jgi:hypothetical protein
MRTKDYQIFHQIHFIQSIPLVKVSQEEHLK